MTDATSRSRGWPWPRPLEEAAYHGVAGRFTELVEPHTEADPAALLVQFLVVGGNFVGRGPYFVADGAHHHCNLFAALVGASSKGRKGTALGHVKRIASEADEEWTKDKFVNGLQSGEGLIQHLGGVADEDRLDDSETGVRVNFKGIGEQFVVVEPEFASVLTVAQRPGATLSSTLRQLWDGGSVSTMKVHNSARIENAHVSLIGHITALELTAKLTATEQANGFANRFLFICVERSKLLPEGGKIESVDFEPVVRQLHKARRFGRRTRELVRDQAARKLWRDVYPTLSEERHGLAGTVANRGEAQVARLSNVYAALDCSSKITVPHLEAALEVWRYSEESARHVFGFSTGDVDADRLLKLLRDEDEVTATRIRKVFGNSAAATGRSERATQLLIDADLAVVETERGERGAPTRRLRLAEGVQ